jgi:hypothetical protein
MILKSHDPAQALFSVEITGTCTLTRQLFCRQRRECQPIKTITTGFKNVFLAFYAGNTGKTAVIVH